MGGLDANRAIDSVARLGPGHAIAVLVLALLAGAGYVLHASLGAVEAGLLELRHEVSRGVEHADARAASADAKQDRMLRLLAATCFSAANGDGDSRRRCEEAAGP